jgi:hypothetical protein
MPYKQQLFDAPGAEGSMLMLALLSQSCIPPRNCAQGPRDCWRADLAGCEKKLVKLTRYLRSPLRWLVWEAGRRIEGMHGSR